MVQPMPGDMKPECREDDSSIEGERELVIPEIEETAEIGTRMVETGVVRITNNRIVGLHRGARRTLTRSEPDRPRSSR